MPPTNAVGVSSFNRPLVPVKVISVRAAVPACVSSRLPPLPMAKLSRSVRVLVISAAPFTTTAAGSSNVPPVITSVSPCPTMIWPVFTSVPAAELPAEIGMLRVSFVPVTSIVPPLLVKGPMMVRVVAVPEALIVEPLMPELLALLPSLLNWMAPSPVRLRVTLSSVELVNNGGTVAPPGKVTVSPACGMLPPEPASRCQLVELEGSLVVPIQVQVPAISAPITSTCWHDFYPCFRFWRNNRFREFNAHFCGRTRPPRCFGNRIHQAE